MVQRKRATALGTSLLLATIAGSVSACAFPIIEFDQRSAPQRMAYREPRQPQPSAGTSLTVPAFRPERQTPGPHTRSVLAPPDPEPELPDTPETSTTLALPRQELSCHKQLEAAGVRYSLLPADAAKGVQWPIRLRGPVEEVEFVPVDKDPVHEIPTDISNKHFSSQAPQEPDHSCSVIVPAFSPVAQLACDLKVFYDWSSKHFGKEKDEKEIIQE